MPKGQRKVSLKLNPLSFILLLLQILLITIGQTPIVIIKLIVESLWFIVKKAVNIFFSATKSLPNIRLPKYKKHKPPTINFRPPNFSLFTLNFKLFRQSRKRGRPRTTPFIPFYIRKLKYKFGPYFPKRTRIAIALSILLIIVYTYTSFIFTAAYLLPSPERLVVSDKPLTTEFYDRNGKLLHRLYEGRNRTLTNLQELPPYLIWATIALEDKNFYRHPGFDLLAIGRALYSRIAQGGEEGASTITQQLIKNTLLTPEKTYTRKIKEVILAFWAERIYSKDEILKMYFNEAPYGGPVWGIDAASQTYFGKKPKELSLAEAAFLAGLPASPTKYSPYGTNPQLTKERQIWVLQRMVEEGYISQKDKELAQAQPLQLQPRSNNIEAAHFVFYVRDQLTQKYGERVVSQGGLKVVTSLDLSLQHTVENIVQSEVADLKMLNVRNGAAMVTDPKTGQILAMVGSRDYHYPVFGNFNVTLSLRQPGSSIKVITYATAFKEGFSPGNTILDTPVSFKDGTRAYSPQNYDGTFHGPVSIRVALGSSYNVPAVRTLATVGIEDMIQTAKDLGISTFNDPKRFGLSLTLGGGEVKMIDMMAVYGTFSNLGKLHSPTPILSVADSSGNILEQYQDLGKQTLKEEIAYLITSILSDNKARTPAFGANSLLNIPPYTVAVKTGTSDNKRDNWTFGYTSDFVVGVWVGNNDNSPMNPSLTSGVTGAAPIWRKITTQLLAKYPSTGFTRPSGIVDALVDGRRDLAVVGSIPKSLVRIRTDADKLIFSDAFSSYATPSASRPVEQAKIENGSTN